MLFLVVLSFGLSHPCTELTLNCCRDEGQFSLHGSRAAQAVVEGIIHHVRITGGIVHCTIEQLADYCGLATVSKNGNRSTTRASRAIQKLQN